MTEEEAAEEVADGADAAAPAEKNPVVAKVDGKEIREEDVNAFIDGLPDQFRTVPKVQLFPMAVNQMIRDEVIAKKVAAAKLDNDEEVEKLAKKAKEDIKTSVFLKRSVEAQITEARLKQEYDSFASQFAGIKETKARHILVESEAEAKNIIARLDAGEDFATLAKEESKDPSAAAQGGDLGYFRKDQMVPEFSDAAFSMDVGTHSKTPVKSQFGWHVIEIEDRRDFAPPAFALVEPQLRERLEQQVLAEDFEKWENEAKVERFDLPTDASGPKSAIGAAVAPAPADADADTDAGEAGDAQ